MKATLAVDVQSAVAMKLRHTAHEYHVAHEKHGKDAPEVKKAERELYAAALAFAGVKLINASDVLE